MVEHLMGLLLLGLGLQSPISTNPAVKGESTANSVTVNAKWNPPRQNLKDTIQASRSAFKADQLKRREQLKSGAIEKHAALKQEIEEKRALFQSEVEANKEEAKAAFEASREEFQKKLLAIKDEKKKQTLEALQTRITDANQKRTTLMTEHLNKIADILTNLIAKAAEAKTNGKDTTALDAAITTAQSAVNAALDAVSVQAAVPYVITVTSESTLKNDVEIVRTQMQTDWKNVHDKIATARKLLSSAIGEWAKLTGQKVPEAIIK